MYKKIIKDALEYTRPFLIGKLYYENNRVSNDISTLIVLNKDGDILTTAHNADVFFATNDYNETYPPILKEISEAKPRNIRKIKEKYGIKKETIIGLQNILVDVANNIGKINIIKHKYLDLAIVSFSNKDDVLVKKYPTFSNNPITPGESICTLGFAFPEYRAFKYDEENFKLVSNYEFMNFPIFPTEGIMCRNIADKEDNISMFEMSNLIISGQEGGPVLDTKGLLRGMIIGNRIVNDFGGPIKIGIAINSATIMAFLDENHIEYEVEKWN